MFTCCPCSGSRKFSNNKPGLSIHSGRLVCISTYCTQWVQTCCVCVCACGRELGSCSLQQCYFIGVLSCLPPAQVGSLWPPQGTPRLGLVYSPEDAVFKNIITQTKKKKPHCCIFKQNTNTPHLLTVSLTTTYGKNQAKVYSSKLRHPHTHRA